MRPPTAGGAFALPKVFITIPFAFVVKVLLAAVVVVVPIPVEPLRNVALVAEQLASNRRLFALLLPRFKSKHNVTIAVAIIEADDAVKMFGCEING